MRLFLSLQRVLIALLEVYLLLTEQDVGVCVCVCDRTRQVSTANCDDSCVCFPSGPRDKEMTNYEEITNEEFRSSFYLLLIRGLGVSLSTDPFGIN